MGKRKAPVAVLAIVVLAGGGDIGRLTPAERRQAIP